MVTRHLSSSALSVPLDLTLPQTSLWSNLESSVARSPDRRCLVFYDSVLTYAEVKRESEYLAGFLQHECGVKRGDRVALYMQNSPQFVIAFYAILRADAAVVPINPMNRTAEIEYMLDDSQTGVLLASQEIAPQALPLLGGKSLRHLIVSAYSDYLTAETDLPVPDFVRAPRQSFDARQLTLWSDALARRLTPLPHTATPDDLCVMPYTSGTTGNPKGCMHTHQLYTRRSCVLNGTVGSRRRAHPRRIAAVSCDRDANSMNSPIYAGHRRALPRWTAVVAELMRRYRVTLTAVPTMVVDLLLEPRSDRTISLR
jgi:fatty-acyl-CoA synthase